MLVITARFTERHYLYTHINYSYHELVEYVIIIGASLREPHIDETCVRDRLNQSNHLL